jgi:hypothetical protein
LTAREAGDTVARLSRGRPIGRPRDHCDNPTFRRSSDRCARRRVAPIGQRTIADAVTSSQDVDREA